MNLNGSGKYLRIAGKFTNPPQADFYELRVRWNSMALFCFVFSFSHIQCHRTEAERGVTYLAGTGLGRQGRNGGEYTESVCMGPMLMTDHVI